MSETQHLRRYPPTLRVAFQDTKAKPERLRGTQDNLRQGRKRSGAATRRMFKVKQMMKRLGL
jgi:hypothetical protein